MQSRLWVTFTLYVLFTITYYNQAYAQHAQGATNEAPTQPQITAEPTPPPPPQPDTATAPQPQPTPQPQPSAAPASQPPLVPFEQTQCIPKCRAGYTCRQGQCVSLCNPPCRNNETCTENGACIYQGAPSQEYVYEREDAAPHYQHTGFFLRFTYGLGWSNAKVSYEIENSGFTQYFGFDIGGAVSENLILHARLSGLINHVDEKETVVLDDSSIDLKVPAIGNMLLGGGLTYYIMPSNLYMTFVLGLASSGFAVEKRGLTDEEEEIVDDELEQPEAGVGFNFDFGKEWWVGSEWGLGVAGRFSYSSVSPNEQAESDDWLSCIGLGVLFTATYN